MFRVELLLLALILTACGKSQAPSPSSTSESTGTPASTPEIALPPLAIALEGDVARKSDTEYEAIGPEIQCSAFLIDSDVPRLVTSEVEWKAEPEDGTARRGAFSAGASGVFFLPDSHSTVMIYATFLEGAGPEIKSPRIKLIVP